jgi:hypothetical protein
MPREFCRNAPLFIIQTVVKAPAKKPLQKITSHDPASTPLVNKPAVLYVIAEITRRMTPM